jgi:hypothetical protein
VGRPGLKNADERIELRVTPELKAQWLAFCREQGARNSSAALRELMAHYARDADLAAWTNERLIAKPAPASHVGREAWVRLDPGITDRWRAHCRLIRQHPTKHLQELMAKAIAEREAREEGYLRYITANGPDDGPRRQITLRLTPTEYAALTHRARLDGFSAARWVIQLLRVALTSDPALTAPSQKALEHASTQILKIGRNFYRMMENIKFAKRDPLAHEVRAALRIIDQFKDWHGQISNVINANVHRWAIFDADAVEGEWERHGRKLTPWSRKLAELKLGEGSDADAAGEGKADVEDGA